MRYQILGLAVYKDYLMKEKTYHVEAENLIEAKNKARELLSIDFPDASEFDPLFFSHPKFSIRKMRFLLWWHIGFNYNKEYKQFTVIIGGYMINFGRPNPYLTNRLRF